VGDIEENCKWVFSENSVHRGLRRKNRVCIAKMCSIR